MSDQVRDQVRSIALEIRVVRMSVLTMVLAALIVASSRNVDSQGSAIYEAASIKPNASGSTSSSYRFLPNGDFAAVNLPVRWLIGMAYGIRPQFFDSRITGGPEAVVSARFDISVKTQNQSVSRRQVLQSVLHDRFSLRASVVVRQQNVYALTLEKPGRLGPQAEKLQTECSSEVLSATPEKGADFPRCAGTMRSGQGTMEIDSIGRVADLIARVQPFVDRPVIDATDINGVFKWRVKFSTTDQLAEFPSVFTAFREQLGFQLTPRRGPVEVLVIDYIERPTEN